MHCCVHGKLGDDEKLVSVLRELLKLSISLVLNPQEDMIIKLSTNMEVNSVVVNTILEFLSVVVNKYDRLLNQRDELSNDFEKTVNAVLAFSRLTESSMGHRTESGQLAFESHGSILNGGIVTNRDSGEAANGDSDKSGVNEKRGKFDGAVVSFLSLLNIKCPSLHGRVVPWTVGTG